MFSESDLFSQSYKMFSTLKFFPYQVYKAVWELGTNWTIPPSFKKNNNRAGIVSAQGQKCYGMKASSISQDTFRSSQQAVKISYSIGALVPPFF